MNGAYARCPICGSLLRKGESPPCSHTDAEWADYRRRETTAVEDGNLPGELRQSRAQRRAYLSDVRRAGRGR